MKIVYYFFSLLIFFNNWVFSKDDGLIPFEQGGKWGYKDSAGIMIIRPQFQLAESFTREGLAAVVDDSGWVYIDRKGKRVIRPFIFDNGPDYFSEGLARFSKNNRYGFFDKTGEIVIPARFDFALPFQEGLSAFCMGCRVQSDGEYSSLVGGKWGFINKQGIVVIAANFDYAQGFRSGKAMVKLKEKWIKIDRNGKVIDK